MRLSHHRARLVRSAAAYVEIFRNTPLLIQLLAIYLLVDRAAARIVVGASPIDGAGAALEAGAADRRAASRATLALLVALVGGVAIGALLGLRAGASADGSRSAPGSSPAAPAWSRAAARVARRRRHRAAGRSPVLDGFLISGGASLTPEFLALWLGLSLFTSASIAELVRAGALAVPDRPIERGARRSA